MIRNEERRITVPSRVVFFLVEAMLREFVLSQCSLEVQQNDWETVCRINSISAMKIKGKPQTCSAKLCTLLLRFCDPLMWFTMFFASHTTRKSTFAC